jgi:hypothetical protein
MAEDDERCGYARAELKLRAAAIVVTMPFEVSLDCVACQRRCRTIVFDGIETAGWCMSGMHAFAGRLLELTQHDGVISAVFQYGYHPFVDAKYGDDRYRGFEAGAPTWVRFNFDVQCAACGAASSCSTQSNMVRPWSAICDCGARLFEDVEPPSVRWRPVKA